MHNSLDNGEPKNHPRGRSALHVLYSSGMKDVLRCTNDIRAPVSSETIELRTYIGSVLTFTFLFLQFLHPRLDLMCARRLLLSVGVVTEAMFGWLAMPRIVASLLVRKRW